MSFYYGYINDNIQLSASGGAAQAISTWAINNGYIIYGVSYSNDFKKAEYKRITDLNELKNICGTKYIYPETASVTDRIIEDIKHNKKVILFGLPCFVASAKTIIKNKGYQIDNLIAVDLICHGPMIKEVHSQFIEALEKKHKSKLNFLNVRDKTHGWNNPYIKARFVNGKTYDKSFYSSLYSKCFALGTMPGCFNCKHKGDNRLSDITIGDNWGINNQTKGFSSQGNSIIITHSKKGESLLKMLDSLMTYYETNDDLLKRHNPYYYSSVKKNKNHDVFQSHYHKSGIFRSILKTLPLKSRIKLLLKGKRAL